MLLRLRRVGLPFHRVDVFEMVSSLNGTRDIPNATIGQNSEHSKVCHLEHSCDPMHVCHLHQRPIVSIRQFRSSHVRLLCRHANNVRSATFWTRAPKDFDQEAMDAGTERIGAPEAPRRSTRHGPPARHPRPGSAARRQAGAIAGPARRSGLGRRRPSRVSSHSHISVARGRDQSEAKAPHHRPRIGNHPVPWSSQRLGSCCVEGNDRCVSCGTQAGGQNCHNRAARHNPGDELTELQDLIPSQ